MDVQTIDQSYAELEQESQQTVQAITTLAQKLQAAGDAGDARAHEWLLDLREIAVSLRDEQTKVAGLLQSLHDFTVNHLGGRATDGGPATDAAPPPQPQYQAPQPQYQAPQPQYQAPQPSYPPPGGYGQGGYGQGGYGQGGYGQGGMLQRFLGGGFGRAIAMGAGFGIGDDIINSIF
ncbi:MAG: hypothetical protein ACYDEN_06905 [Acidimicrobiales bacterium]